ncbi:NAD-dependent epimerase/dehydratase family protein [Subtercola lobariae]|uniref:NAD-dependent epimerase/dehydratase domain-containing protein n=1 Tax=Subtercola lobariae TaxID=1588641 RepID=A0A917B1V6_9MICO|nr:NAD-dependent epimerase/dehydratase family protein [Subtercola lobariae]GGF14033.1 hypothetical protein GCM10011399_04880 [Subtercola lobariae]
MTVATWVVGSGGLLGKALMRQIAARDHWQLLPPEPLDWLDQRSVFETSTSQLRLLFGQLGPDDEWCVLWVAGSGVIGTSRDHLNLEREQFRDVLGLIEKSARDAGVTSRGTVFLASSAGGVYGGSANPPYTENTAAVPLSPYGETKLAMEAELDRFASSSGVSVLKGRIANLYGPGQKLSKMQGLISTLAKAQFSPTPASIFVPLDTVRDYLFVDDCAQLICDAIDMLRQTAALVGPINVTKILASGEGVTIGALVGYFQALTRRRPHVMLGSSPTISMQALDLRLKSVVWPELDERSLTSLPAGIHATMLDILAHIQGSQNEV